MAKDTDTLLKSILLNVHRAKTLKEARESVELLCDKEDIVAVKEMVRKENPED